MAEAGKSGGRTIATIKLDERQRKQIATELGVSAGIDYVPDTIHVTRVNHRDLGLTTRNVRDMSWVLVMD